MRSLRRSSKRWAKSARSCVPRPTCALGAAATTTSKRKRWAMPTWWLHSAVPMRCARSARAARAMPPLFRSDIAPAQGISTPRRSAAIARRSPPGSRAMPCSTTVTGVCRCTSCLSSAAATVRTNPSSTPWRPRARPAQSSFPPGRASRPAPRASAHTPWRPHFAPRTIAVASCARRTAPGRSSSSRLAPICRRSAVA